MSWGWVFVSIKVDYHNLTCLGVMQDTVFLIKNSSCSPPHLLPLSCTMASSSLFQLPQVKQHFLLRWAASASLTSVLWPRYTHEHFIKQRETFIPVSIKIDDLAHPDNNNNSHQPWNKLCELNKNHRTSLENTQPITLNRTSDSSSSDINTIK